MLPCAETGISTCDVIVRGSCLHITRETREMSGLVMKAFVSMAEGSSFGMNGGAVAFRALEAGSGGRCVGIDLSSSGAGGAGDEYGWHSNLSSWAVSGSMWGAEMSNRL